SAQSSTTKNNVKGDTSLTAEPLPHDRLGRFVLKACLRRAFYIRILALKSKSRQINSIAE
ncbi:MAG: hypothetical protein IK120_08465, partial [Muribaculaceae bacterium]|nr:hypothetical protein [Muribaculaceae bacterium]